MNLYDRYSPLGFNITEDAVEIFYVNYDIDYKLKTRTEIIYKKDSPHLYEIYRNYQEKLNGSN